jgi:hypothetical protein
MKFRVHTRHGKRFWRNGFMFEETPRVVDTDALGWTPAQLREFLSPATLGVLYVEELRDDEPVPIEDRIVLTGEQARELGVGMTAGSYRRDAVLAAGDKLDTRAPHPLATEIMVALAADVKLEADHPFLWVEGVRLTAEPRRIPVAEVTREQRAELLAKDSLVTAVEVVPRGCAAPGRWRVEEGEPAATRFAELQRAARAAAKKNADEEKRVAALVAKGKAAQERPRA